MCNLKCGGCTPSLIGKILLIIGGINWGLVGVGMFMQTDWNVVRMLLSSWPSVEAVVYVLVGIAAIMSIFGCRCGKCAATCANCRGTGGAEERI
ncbi:MAG: DUF378 domain-containing protein [Patescibacteria group bacterium]